MPHPAIAASLALVLIAGCAATPAPSAPASAAEAPRAAAPFRVETRGEGRAVVFIPGLASGPGTFDRVAAAPGVEAHLVTLGGFAGAPPADGPFFPTRVAALKDYIERRDLKNVVIVGHSLGGVMAMKLALAAPDRIDALVLVDSTPFLAQFMLGAADEETARARAAAVGAQLLATPDDAYAAQQAAFAKSQARAPEAQARILADSLASDRATVSKAVTEMLSEDLRDDIAGVRQRALMLYPFRAGGPFTAAQVDAAYSAQYAAMPDVRLIRIDDSAHFIADDAPDAVAAALADALGDD